MREVTFGRTDPVILTLGSPMNSRGSIEFTLDGTNDEHVRMEVIETMLVAFEFFPEVKAVVDREYPELHKVTSITFLRDAMTTFNKAAKTVAKLWKGTTTLSHRADQPIEGPLFKRIWTLAYNRSITDPRSLNKHYGAFSSETYGETSYDRMQKIIDQVKPSKKDVFVDLGSGIGQLVIHMAGASAARRSIGIEIADLPFKYAVQLETEFKRFMRFFGKNPRPFHLEHGDFLDPKYRHVITEEATILLLNNIMFSPQLEDTIKRELLSELKDGTMIITTKSYARTNRSSVTERHLNDISAILDVSVLEPCTNAGSWTSNYVPYFLHVVNRSKLEMYYHQKQNVLLSGAGDRRSEPPPVESKTPKSRKRTPSTAIREPVPRAHSMAPRLANLGRKKSAPLRLCNTGVPPMPSNSRIQLSQSARTPNTPLRTPRKAKTPIGDHPESKAAVRPVRKSRTPVHELPEVKPAPRSHRKAKTPTRELAGVRSPTRALRLVKSVARMDASGSRKQKTSNGYYVDSDSTRSSSMERPPVLTPMPLDPEMPSLLYPLDPAHGQHFIRQSPSLSHTEQVELRLLHVIREELANMQRLQRMIHDLHGESAELALKNHIMSEQWRQLSGQWPFE
ncbi:hypothetical protein QR680_013919 [Steinernema hermaphroditum]|uniref:Histone-lysine N-methyltransferase, H3 lysine-79 specific n=1 Tax=Steinernema hermaphroditum TaxID=289476 RepID=A0AA39M2C8_9BILA|nr:hypothetical protein QR680_013919 [Steinernema hermaphroditum]